MPNHSITNPSSDCRAAVQFSNKQSIGQLFRDYGEAYIRIYQPHRSTIQLIRSIRLCRTPALGGKQITCKGCGQVQYQYFSCGNSQCPQCQGIKRLQWQDRLAKRMLKLPYAHITFTLPHQLNGLARRNKQAVYGLLVRSAWYTIKKLCAKEENLGALPGMTAILHSWGSDLKYHLHVHCLVTFGGLTTNEHPEWRWPKRKYKLAPFRKLRGIFRRIFLKKLRSMMKDGAISYHHIYEEIEPDVIKKQWVVNHQRPTAETKVIEEYLGRYICRIAISNKRLTYDSHGQNVRIEYNDYAKQVNGQAAPKAYRNLEPLLAMQLILQHQLPRYFQKVRHYGLHASVTYDKIQAHLPEQLKRNGATVRTIIQILKALLKQTPFVCEHCGGSEFEINGIAADRSYLSRFIVLHQRSPPCIGRADKAG